MYCLSNNEPKNKKQSLIFTTQELSRLPRDLNTNKNVTIDFSENSLPTLLHRAPIYT